MLKARFGASEVIVTIMLNFIVLALLNYIVAAHVHVAETLHTPEIHAGALPRLADVSSVFAGSAANTTFVLALAAAAGVWWYLFRTRPGYELRAVGLQPDAAEYGGVQRRRRVGEDDDADRRARRARRAELRARLQALLRGRIRRRAAASSASRSRSSDAITRSAS